MPTNDDVKLARGPYRIDEPADTEAAPPPRASDRRPDTPAAAVDKPRQRGPYKISDEELLKDPQVAAFRAALRSISDPQKRGALTWLVMELSRHKEKGR
jgi:hypothetical protein